MTIEQAGEFLRVPSIPSLPNQRVDAQPAHEDRVHLLAAREQLRTHVKVRIHRTRRVQQGHADVQRGRVAVVDPEAVERRRKVRDVLRDVLPEPRVR